VCLARSGYDGPTGVGTPDGIAAFQPPEGEAPQFEGSGEAGEGEGSVGAGSTPSSGQGASGTANASAAGGSPGTGAPTAAGPRSVQLSRLALSASALTAIRGVRPRASQVGFAFTLNIAARLRASLARRVRARGRTRWQQLPSPLVITALGGRNHRHLVGRGLLKPGVYRLTLAPVGGAPRSLVFTVRQQLTSRAR
jgi:hypothetical protein